MTATVVAPSIGPYPPATGFDWRTYLSERAGDPRVLHDPRGRRALTRNDPLAFALVYLRRHLASEATGGQVTFADAHLDWCAQAREWIGPIARPRSWRRAYVAPRSMGKSSWWFLILPMWAAATGRSRFAVALADASVQSEEHLATFRRELEENPLLRADYPDLCTPAARERGVSASDNRRMYRAASGFTFAARGIDAASLGLKVGADRPDLIVMDDVEPGEGGYSAYQAEQRLATITDVVLPLNDWARVVLVGTVTMVGSVVHQLVRASEGESVAWVEEENFTTTRYPPILVDEVTGGERSCWPARWSLEYLRAHRHERSYAKNFANDPMGADGGWWEPRDFRVLDAAGPIWVLTVDPATTTKTTSDETGIAVVSGGTNAPLDSRGARVVVHHAEGVKATGRALADHLTALLVRFPRVGRVHVEVNQGGDYVAEALAGLPATVTTHTAKVSKEERFGQALTAYQRGLVAHATSLPALEAQLVAFPKAPHDDIADAAVTGVLGLLGGASPASRAV